MTVYDILESVSWPTDVLLLDFETYFDDEYTLSEITGPEYVADPRFEFTGLGIQINEERPVFINGCNVPSVIKRLRKKYGKALHNCTVVAKNCKFDVLVLAEKFGIYPPYVIDIEDLQRYYDSRVKHNLKEAAKMFGLPPKGKTDDFKGLHQHEIDFDKMKQYCLRDVEDEKYLFDLLLPCTDNPEFEFPLMVHTLNLYLKPLLELDIQMSENIRRDMDIELQRELDKARWIVEGYSTKDKTTVEDILRARTLFPKILADILPKGEEVPMKEGANNTLIPALAKEDVGFQLLLAHSNEKVRNLCKAKAASGSWNLHQKKIDTMIRYADCADGKMRMAMKYYGCHTGRWSGFDWNPLNLGGKGRGKAIHPLIGEVRHTLKAPDGMVLLINDSAQIEARELAWLAGQNDLVKGFANGEDIYSQFATVVFGEEVRKPTEDDDPGTSALLTIRRGFGKDGILGCGYGMGSDTFYDRCRQNETIRPLFDSGQYDRVFVDGLIKKYRTTYSGIPKFWDTIEKCFRLVTKYRDKVVSYYIDDDGVCQHDHIEKAKPILRNSLLTFWNEDGTTIIQLPSGRRLFYHHASVNKEGRIKDIHGPLWGGTLTENVIQAICRDLLCGWLLECEENKIKIVHHTYDELVGLVWKDYAEEKFAVMQGIMRSGPDWARGLPLDVEGKITERFTK